MRVLGETDPRLERYREVILAAVNQYRHHGKLGEDLMQEAWLPVLRNAHKIDGQRHPRAYVARLARGGIQHYFRDLHTAIHLPAWRWGRGERPPEVLSLDALMEDEEEGGELEIGFTEPASE